MKGQKVTTHHMRIHWCDEMAMPFSRAAEMVDLDRTVWFDDDLAVPDGSDDLAVCEIIWSRFNRHDAPDQHPSLDELGLRSLCVGDVVEFAEPGNRRFYVCASFGWDAIEGVRSKTVAELVEALDTGTDPRPQ